MVKLKVEPVIGSSIENMALETWELACKMNMVIVFDFNGCICNSWPSGSPFKLVEKYHQDCQSKNPTNYISNI